MTKETREIPLSLQVFHSHNEYKAHRRNRTETLRLRDIENVLEREEKLYHKEFAIHKHKFHRHWSRRLSDPVLISSNVRGTKSAPARASIFSAPASLRHLSSATSMRSSGHEIPTMNRFQRVQRKFSVASVLENGLLTATGTALAQNIGKARQVLFSKQWIAASMKRRTNLISVSEDLEEELEENQEERKGEEGVDEPDKGNAEEFATPVPAVDEITVPAIGRFRKNFQNRLDSAKRSNVSDSHSGVLVSDKGSSNQNYSSDNSNSKNSNNNNNKNNSNRISGVNNNNNNNNCEKDNNLSSNNNNKSNNSNINNNNNNIDSNTLTNTPKETIQRPSSYGGSILKRRATRNSDIKRRVTLHVTEDTDSKDIVPAPTDPTDPPEEFSTSVLRTTSPGPRIDFDSETITDWKSFFSRPLVQARLNPLQIKIKQFLIDQAQFNKQFPVGQSGPMQTSEIHQELVAMEKKKREKEKVVRKRKQEMVNEVLQTLAIKDPHILFHYQQG